MTCDDSKGEEGKSSSQYPTCGDLDVLPRHNNSGNEDGNLVFRASRQRKVMSSMAGMTLYNDVDGVDVPDVVDDPPRSFQAATSKKMATHDAACYHGNSPDKLMTMYDTPSHCHVPL